MSRYRNIHCLIWNDDKFPFASDACQLVFFHLLTTPLSSPFGLYKASLDALASEKRWTPKEYRKAFGEALAKCFVKHDEKHLVIYIPHFLKYNPPQNPNVLKSWSILYAEIPECELKVEFYHELKALVEVLGKAFLEVFAKAFREGARKGIGIQEQYQEQYQYQEQEQDPPLITSPKGGLNTFHTFWVAYPKKEGKGKAEEAWKKEAAHVPLETILAGLEKWTHSQKWADGFITMPATWLNQKRWEDDPVPASPFSSLGDRNVAAADRLKQKLQAREDTHGRIPHGD